MANVMQADIVSGKTHPGFGGGKSGGGFGGGGSVTLPPVNDFLSSTLADGYGLGFNGTLPVAQTETHPGFGGGKSGGGFGGGGNVDGGLPGDNNNTGGDGGNDDVYYGYKVTTPAKPTYTAAQLPSATSQADYINAMYNANEQRQRAALEAEYTANVGALDRQAAGIPAQYQNAANAAEAQAAINQAAFNERAAASGLNNGAAGQAALAQNNALLAQMSTIRQKQAEALNDVESQRVSLQTQYQKAIADAIAANEADRAAALYNEAKRVDESLVNTAINQAAENYRAWQAMYK